MPQKSDFQNVGLSSCPPHFRKISIFYRVLGRFNIVLEFLTLLDNSSVNFRAQWTFKQKIPTPHFHQTWPKILKKKILKRKFWKVPRDLVRVLPPPGIFLQKSPITFFAAIKIQKAITLQSWPKILKTKFWKVPRVLVKVLPPPPGYFYKNAL